MNVWRPSGKIVVKAIGLLVRDDRLFASEVTDDSGQIKGVRPPGGTVEFGETWQRTIVREFDEEFGVDVEVHGTPLVLENIFQHEGATGHEVVFAARIETSSKVLNDECVSFTESNGVICNARWFPLEKLDQPGNPALFPDGLTASLEVLSP